MAIINGDDGPNTLTGTLGNDTINGFGGNDFVDGGDGIDNLDGGFGLDTLVYSTSFAGVSVDLVSSFPSGGTAGGDTITSFENVVGSDFADALSGNALPNQLSGGDGNDNLAGLANVDVLSGENGDDVLDGGSSDDTLDGGAGADQITGGDGNDTITGGAGADQITGGAGFDVITYSGAVSLTVNLATLTASGGDAEGDVIGGADIEGVSGGSGGDTLTGSALNNTLSGGDGNDTLAGMDGADTIQGGAGDDVLVLDGDESLDNLDGGDGTDTVSGYDSASGVAVDLVFGAGVDTLIGIENIVGSNHFDTLAGDDGANVLRGEGGSDWLTGRGGADSLFGGDGIDRVSYTASAVGVTVNLALGTASGGEAEGDILDSIEEVFGSDNGGDALTGSSGANALFGFDGDDLLRGGAGADSLSGSLGVDTATYYDSAAAVTIDLVFGLGAGGDAQGDTLNGIEKVTGSNIGGDSLIGGSGDNVLSGWGGDDLLRGGAGADGLFGGLGTDTASYAGSASGVTVDLAAGAAAGGDAQGDILSSIENLTGSDAGGDTLAGTSGANTLRGGGGDDLLRGGAGADSLFGDAGADTATYYASAAAVTVDLVAGTAAGGDAQGDTLAGIENLTGSNTGGDTLTGGSGTNILRGFGGDDLLRGGAGADTLEGGVGTDLASYYNSAAAVTVNLAAGTGSGGDAQGDILVSIENVNGSNFNDTLVGNGAANVLRGLAGRDTFTGGGGADRFVYVATGESGIGASADRITDFSHAQGDRIDLSGIDANGGAPGNGAFAFIGTGLYTGVAGQLRCAVTSPGVTTVAGDVNGDGVSDFHIALTGTFALVAGDFVL